MPLSAKPHLPDPTDPIALTQALVRCRSVTPEDGGALQLIEDVLTPLGFQCHRVTMREAGTPDIGNLYARWGTGAPNLCFAGHTDVVPPGDETLWTHSPFDAVMADGKLYGRGTVDMKGAIAAFMAATARVLIGGVRPKGSISFLITGDEEGPSINGTVKVLDWLKGRGETLDAALVGEPSNPTALGQEIKIGRRGSLNGYLVVEGRQGHAAYPKLAENPVPKLIALLSALTALKLDDGTPDFEASNLEVTVIGAPNTATNVIPASASARFNVRYNTTWTRPRLEAHLRQVLAGVAGNVSARFALTFSGTGDVFLTKPGALVETMKSAVEAELGVVPQLTTNGGTSDARFIQAYCPVIEFGLTNRLAHHIDEHVHTADLERLTRVYERFLVGYFDQQ